MSYFYITLKIYIIFKWQDIPQKCFWSVLKEKLDNTLVKKEDGKVVSSTQVRFMWMNLRHLQIRHTRENIQVP